ncbi:MAG: bifunctional 4-hydroxy-2-oxoglutarate aldolase/2-dehydro-3-deoxy-phosphogluconate aldolase [Acidimicrobiia bacterium]
MIRLEIPAAVASGKIIAIARRVQLAKLIDIAEVLATAGVSVLEVTLDGEDALASIEHLAPGPLTVGAGTIRSVADAVQANKAGAEFIVMPHTDPEVVRSVTARGVPVMPGALTPSEAVTAWSLGASAVKLFPAMLGGPDYLKALRGPLEDISFVLTGGIDDTNAAAYLRAGAVAVGVGGWLTAGSDLDAIGQRAASLVSAIRSV